MKGGTCKCLHFYFLFIHAAYVQSGPDSGSEGLPELPDFLSNKHFLLYG